MDEQAIFRYVYTGMIVFCVSAFLMAFIDATCADGSMWVVLATGIMMIGILIPKLTKRKGMLRYYAYDLKPKTNRDLSFSCGERFVRQGGRVKRRTDPRGVRKNKQG